MKFTISVNELLKALMDLSKAIPVKSPLPILENFLFVLDEKGLQITASDSETTLRTVIDVENIEENGSIAVPARHLLDLLKNLPDQPISIETKASKKDGENDSTFVCNWESGKSDLPYFPAEDYPEIKSLTEEENCIEIPAETLLEAINNTVYATSDEELRPVMTGILFDIDEDKTTFVGTDAHKLICYTSNKIESKVKTQFILSKKVANILKSLIAKEQDNITIKFNGQIAEFHYGKENIVICRLIAGKYPDYRTVIPKNNSNVLKIDKQLLINIVKRISVCANKASNQIKFDLQEGQLEITAQDISFSLAAYEKIQCDYSGESFSIGLRSNFIIEMLSNIDCSNIVMKFKDKKAPVLVLPSEEEENSANICGLLMPLVV